MKKPFVVAAFDRTPCTEKEMQDNANKVLDLYKEGYRHIQSFTMGQLDYGVFALQDGRTVNLTDILNPGKCCDGWKEEKPKEAAAMDVPNPTPTVIFNKSERLSVLYHKFHEACKAGMDGFDVIVGSGKHGLVLLQRAEFTVKIADFTILGNGKTLLGYKLTIIDPSWTLESIEYLFANVGNPQPVDGGEATDQLPQKPKVIINEEMITEQVLAIVKSVYGSVFANRDMMFAPETFLGGRLCDELNGRWSCFTEAEWTQITSAKEIVQKVVAHCSAIEDAKQKSQRETADTTAPKDQPLMATPDEALEIADFVVATFSEVYGIAVSLASQFSLESCISLDVLRKINEKYGCFPDSEWKGTATASQIATRLLGFWAKQRATQPSPR